MTRFLIILLVFAACSPEPSIKTGLEGEPLPNFEMVLSNNKGVFNTKSLTSDKPFVIFVFLPDCPYSQQQMKELTSNIKQLKDYEIVAVTNAAPQSLGRFEKEFNLAQYKNIIIGSDTTFSYGNYLGAKGVPCMALYDKKRVLNTVFLGNTSYKILKDVDLK